MTELLNIRNFLAVLISCLLLAGCDQTETPKPYRELAEEILAEAIAIKSVDDGSGSSVIIANAMAKRLTDAGFPASDVLVTGPRPEVGVVVARYRGDGTGGAPIIVMAHMDVVDAIPTDWNRDPFTLEKDDTFFYGRGVNDNKTGVAVLIANFIRLKQESYVPNRDIIMVLTGDEETTGDSINWLANERRDLIDAAYALNTDAGDNVSVNGKYYVFQVQGAEKMYFNLEFTVRNSGGHSSRPRPDNAIYELMAGLSRLQAYTFPTQVNDVTKGQLMAEALSLGGDMGTALAAVANGVATEGQIALVQSDPSYNTLTRTTCVPTMLRGGHAENALPQTATANINCRVFPGTPADEIEAKLLELMAIPGVEVTRTNIPKPSDPSPLTPEIMGIFRSLVNKHYGEIPVVPVMSAGATDGLYLRNVGIPVYGASGVYSEAGEANAHGMDENIRIKSFFESLSFWYDLMKAHTGGET